MAVYLASDSEDALFQELCHSNGDASEDVHNLSKELLDGTDSATRVPGAKRVLCRNAEDMGRGKGQTGMIVHSPG